MKCSSTGNQRQGKEAANAPRRPRANNACAKGCFTASVMSSCVKALFNVRPSRFTKLTSRSYSGRQVEQPLPAWKAITACLKEYSELSGRQFAEKKGTHM
eukprot:g1433.t1